MRHILFAAGLFAVGCAHHDQKKDEPTPVAAAPSPAAAPQPATCTDDQACGARQLCLNGTCTDTTADLAECSAVRVHFDTSSADLKAEDKTTLDRMARCLKADHALTVTIEGNADERGGEDMNMTLGEKRAFAVSNYLTAQGVSEQQLKTVSYGKDNPRCLEHDEACWAQNRRSAVKPQNLASRADTPKRGKKKGAEAPKDPAQPSKSMGSGSMGGVGGGSTP